MKIRLFTGKGGVGKTTIAAATALKSSGMGAKTLVISTDPAHSLSDSLNKKLGPEPLKIGKNLFAQELNVYYSMKKYWENLRKIIFEILRWQGMDTVQAEELSALPGMEEVSVFLWLEKYYSEDEFDFIVIDSAPTGETLSMLSIPQMAKWWSSKLLMLPKFAAKTMGSVIDMGFGIPLSQSMDELDSILEKLEKMNKFLTDPGKTGGVIVINPEKMVIEEARRAYSYLGLYGINVDLAVINRIIPENGSGDFFKKYIESQKGYLEAIERDFSAIKIKKIFHKGEEIFGIKELEKLGNQIYDDFSPMEILKSDKPYEISEDGEKYLMEINLPFTEKKDLTAVKKGNYLIVDFKEQRKHIYLPRFLHFYELDEVFLKQEKLCISFVES